MRDFIRFFSTKKVPIMKINNGFRKIKISTYFWKRTAFGEKLSFVHIRGEIKFVFEIHI